MHLLRLVLRGIVVLDVQVEIKCVTDIIIDTRQVSGVVRTTVISGLHLVLTPSLMHFSSTFSVRNTLGKIPS